MNKGLRFLNYIPGYKDLDMLQGKLGLPIQSHQEWTSTMTQLTSPTRPYEQDVPCICLNVFSTTVCSGYFHVI